MKNVLLVILDGWGHSEFAGAPDPGNAVEQARVPRFRALYDDYPRTRLACSGADVGLPDGQMGNSEVGHLNLGAGRVVYQDIARVDRAIADGSFGSALGLDAVVPGLLEGGHALHAIGLVSDGGVHSHLRHLEGLAELLPAELDLRVHCLTDGRDTSPTGGAGYVASVEEICSRSPNWHIASVCGRYYAMDRDKRWERTQQAYELIARGRADRWEDSADFLPRSYEAGVTDEFVLPTGIRGVGERGIQPGDAVLLFNFRADRMRQLSSALARDDFDGFARDGDTVDTLITLTRYEATLPATVAFPPVAMSRCLGEVVSREGLAQLRAAETEKYAHVTYFFNGGEETPFPGEDRALTPSPKVPTYDLQPEMSAEGVKASVIDGITSGAYRFILVNFANPDMVGHTGSIPAAVKAVETVDACLGEILDTVAGTPDWVALVTADHGNCEYMRNEDGSPNTAHTTTPVDFVVFDPGAGSGGPLRGPGRLADVAPTVLHFLGIDPPDEMTGRSLVA